jgi:hypothetical protein
VRQAEWNFDDGDAGEDRPTKTYDYRATLGSEKYASQETAAGVFGGAGSPPDPARPPTRPRRPMARPTNGGPPPPKPIVLPKPVDAPKPIPLTEPKPIRWTNKDDATSPPPRAPSSRPEVPPSSRPAAPPGPPADPWSGFAPNGTPQMPPGMHPGAPGMPPPGIAPNGVPHLPANGLPHPPPNGRPPAGQPGGSMLADQPLRAPAPPVTAIRVLPVPPDGFGQSMWFSGTRPNPPAPPPAPLPPPPMVPPPTPPPTMPGQGVLNTYPLKQWKADNPVVDDAPVISWLDED